MSTLSRPEMARRIKTASPQQARRTKTASP